MSVSSNFKRKRWTKAQKEDILRAEKKRKNGEDSPSFPRKRESPQLIGALHGIPVFAGHSKAISGVDTAGICEIIIENQGGRHV